jgi:hypothetical protein
MKRPRLALGCLLLVLAALPAGAAVRALLDRSEVAPGETVQLTLVLDGQSRAQPDLTPLRTDFDILGESTRSNIQIINGSYSSRTELALTLSPKHSGQLTIPPLSWGSDRSQPLTLTVAAGSGDQSAGATASSPRVFITSEVQPKQPYLLAAVHLTVRIYAADPLNRPSLDLPTSHDVLVRQVGDDEVGTAEKNGASYYVVTRRYLLFPQRSGTLSIAGPTLSAQVIASTPRDPRDPFSGLLGGSPFGTTMRPIRVHGDPIVLEVQPRPASAAAAPYWLPARSVTLEGDWNPGNLQAHVGDPITLDLKLQAVGLTAAQLPDLTTLLSVPSELKAYPEQPKLNDADQSDTVQASREQTLALIADQPGRYSIPALHLTWWDTGANEAREASLPARTLVVLAAAGSPPPVATARTPSTVTTPAPALSNTSRSAAAPEPAPASRPAGGLPWRWISLGLTLLWLLTLGGWLLSRRKRKIALPQLTEGLISRSAQARAAFLDACRHDDAPAARRHLLDWAGATWGKAPRGLNALAAQLKDPNVTALLRELDRACFAGGDWNGEALASALAELPDRQAKASRRSSKLAPLYR